MNLSLKWLNEFVNIDIAPKDFAEAMTMSGSKVESYHTQGEKLQNIVVGRVLFIDEHPNADRLLVCKVDIGNDKPIQIITNATNLRAKDLVPVALDNSTLADGTKIHSGKIRGILSAGMFCSIAELGITKQDFPNAIENGIFVLDKNCTPGQDIRQALGLDDTIFEFEITSNRPDCFSVIGLSREVSATFDKLLRLHTPAVKAGNGNCEELLRVSVEVPELCPFYSARIVKNVQIKESPRWLCDRLRSMGIRPINNIVDITNYVLLEYGQPMHAFDLRAIENGTITIRRANEAETITTLDGVERTLTSSNLVIADSKKPLAIAGVMGGEGSGINADTTTIVFESANFSGSSVRMTAKSQGMRTDASSRYEKGLDPNNCIPALQRACELIELLDAGDVLDGTVIVDYSKKQQRMIPLDPEWINRFLNTSLSREQMKKILKKIGCQFEEDDIVVPSFRPDLVHKADIAEEIARFYGYNNITSTPLIGVAQGKYSDRQKFDTVVSQTMLSLGLSEIMTYSFIGQKDYDKVLIPQNHALRNSVVISNPLGEDSSIMRTTPLPSMMEALSKNYNNRNETACLFEIAKEYHPTNDGKLPEEKSKLTAGLYGKEIDFFYVKGIAEELLEKISVTQYEVEATDKEHSFHPGRCAVFTVNGETLGVVGEIHPSVCDNYGIEGRVYAILFDMEIMHQNSQKEKVYSPLPKFPSVSRDLALICDDEVTVASLQKTIQSAAGDLLEKIHIFDVYKGKQIAEGKKSVAFRISLRSMDQTLTDSQVTEVMKNIMHDLEQCGVSLRS